MIQIEYLWKSYGQESALEELNVTIERGEVFSILGRNGVGKTTLIECLVGLREVSQGKIIIKDDRGQTKTFAEMKQKVGVQPQEYALFERLTVQETCELFASMYEQPIPVPELLKKMYLEELKDKQIIKLSTGQK